MEAAIVPLPSRVRQELTFRKDELESILPDWMTYKRFVNMSLMAITRTPKLANCDFPSIYLSLMECARLGLYPDGRQAAIVPYKGKATLLPMVQGIIELMLRSPAVAKVESRIVYSDDHFDFEYGLNPRLEHVPAKEKSENRQITYSYAIVFWKNTNPTFEVVMREEIDKARNSSSAPNSPAWIIWESEQSRKVAVKRIAKYVDLTPEAQALISWDHAIYGDPTMQTPLLEGPSQEYKNQHVKVETEANLESLKEKIEPKDNGDEPEEETKETQEQSGEEIIEAPKRMENQWEETIFHFIIDGGFVSGNDKKQMEHRLAAILNKSPFFDLPFGELKLIQALAWVMLWEKIKVDHPRKKPENRLKQANIAWENTASRMEMIDLADSKIPPDTQQPLI